VTLPKGLTILIQFTQKDLVNLVEFGDYLTFLIRTLLVFGIAFEIPVFVILLNLAGVLSGRALAAHRPWIVLGTFVFAAVATPSTDPFTMLILAIPMLILFGVSEMICRVLDRRRHEKAQQAGVGDDELSPL
jgi:sec-independent protein translocase protein TatC